MSHPFPKPVSPPLPGTPPPKPLFYVGRASDKYQRKLIPKTRATFVDGRFVFEKVSPEEQAALAAAADASGTE